MSFKNHVVEHIKLFLRVILGGVYLYVTMLLVLFVLSLVLTVFGIVPASGPII